MSHLFSAVLEVRFFVFASHKHVCLKLLFSITDIILTLVQVELRNKIKT